MSTKKIKKYLFVLGVYSSQDKYVPIGIVIATNIYLAMSTVICIASGILLVIAASTNTKPNFVKTWLVTTGISIIFAIVYSISIIGIIGNHINFILATALSDLILIIVFPSLGKNLKCR